MMALIGGVAILVGFLLAGLGFALMDISAWSEVLYRGGMFLVALGVACAAWALAVSIWVEVVQ